MERYILDTNFFFNLQIKSGFGDNPTEIIKEVARVGKKLKQQRKATLYMPPRVLDEFLTFVDKDDDYVENLLAVVTIKSPEEEKINFPAKNFYALVKDIRHRSYRGLKVAEEEMHNAVENMKGADKLSKVDYQKTMGEHITKLRDRYRNATRAKFLDSVADLDLIVLAKELDATIVTSDEGVVAWGRLFGVKEMLPQIFKKQLESLHSA